MMSGMSGLGGMSGVDRSQRMQEMFTQTDQDGSGGLSQAELETKVGEGGRGGKLLENFGKIDTDGDGELSQTEIQSGASQVRGQRGGQSRSASDKPVRFSSEELGSISSILETLNSGNESGATPSLSELLEQNGFSSSQVTDLTSHYNASANSFEALFSTQA